MVVLDNSYKPLEKFFYVEGEAYYIIYRRKER